MTDESTSPVRQLEHGRSAVQARGWTEAGVATDLDVSATKYSPFDRPELGNWLKNRHHEFDVIVVRRLDRLVRSSKTRSWSGYVPVPPDRTLGVPASHSLRAHSSGVYSAYCPDLGKVAAASSRAA
ncbi:recombinase family protein [Nocardia sputi]|nr:MULTISPECIES: recombinase family protein [Nocardia]